MSIVQEKGEPNNLALYAEFIDLGLASPELHENVPSATLPSVMLYGSLYQSSDIDVFRIVLHAGDIVTFDVDTAVANTDPVDTVLLLRDAGLATVAQQDDSLAVDNGSSATYDPFLTYQAQSSGDFYLSVSSHGQASYGRYLLNFTVQSAPVALTGGAAGEALSGWYGNDSIAGGGGNDTIDGLAGNDTLRGGDGADSLRGGNGQNILLGEAGNDSLDGGIDNDRLIGGAGNDSLWGFDGDDTLSGGAGNDTIESGPGHDSVLGGDGDDALGALSALYYVYMEGDAPKYFNGGAGNDRIDAGLLRHGACVVVGGSGNDTLQGLSGDEFHGDEGNDDIRVGLQLLAARSSIDGGDGSDRLTIDGNTISTGSLSPGTITLRTQADGSGSFVLPNVAGGSLTIDFTGIEAINFQDLPLDPPITNADLAGGTGNDRFDVGKGNDTLAGAGGNDTLLGGAGDDVLNGGAGNDSLAAGAGTDRVSGGSGNDTLTGGTDAADTLDVLDGGTGNDLLQGAATIALGGDGDDVVDLRPTTAVADGGAGNDLARIDLSGAGNAATVENFGDGSGFASAGGRWTDFDGFERVSIVGTAFNDRLQGGPGADTLAGGAGNDTLDGAGGTDTASYASAGAAVTVSLAVTAAQATGGAGSDTLRNLESLVGSRFADTLTGSAGSNLLDGGDGSDRLTGGAGADTFVLRSLVGSDTITDFTSGSDKLRISQKTLPVGDGDTAIEGAVRVAGPGGFAPGAELVIVTGNIAGSITTASAAAEIGSASAAYAAGQHALFMVDNGSSSALLMFTSAGADALVSASELTLLATLSGCPSTVATDLLFGA